MTEFRYEVWTAFGQSLRDVRAERGFTQHELANQLLPFWPGSSQSALAKMERGERLVGIEHLVALGWVLRVEPQRLLPTLRMPEPGDVDIAALREERDRLEEERDQLQIRYDQVQTRLFALDAVSESRQVFVPEGARGRVEHPTET